MTVRGSISLLLGPCPSNVDLDREVLTEGCSFQKAAACLFFLQPPFLRNLSV